MLPLLYLHAFRAAFLEQNKGNPPPHIKKLHQQEHKKKNKEQRRQNRINNAEAARPDPKVKSIAFGERLEAIHKNGDFSVLGECKKIAYQMANDEPSKWKKIYGYNILMQTLLKSANLNLKLRMKASNVVLEILDEIEEIYFLSPNTMTYNLAMKALMLRARKVFTCYT